MNQIPFKILAKIGPQQSFDFFPGRSFGVGEKNDDQQVRKVFISDITVEKRVQGLDQVDRACFVEYPLNCRNSYCNKD